MSSACSLELWCWQNGASAAVVFPVSSGPHPGAFLSGRAWWAHWVVDGTFSLPETAPVAHPPSPPSTVGQLGGPSGKKEKSLRWSNRLRCNYVKICTSTDNRPNVYINRQGGLHSCHNSPAPSLSRVRSIWGRVGSFTFWARTTIQPMSCHELRSPGNEDSIPRWSSWFGGVSEPLRQTCFPLLRPSTASCFTPWLGEHSAWTHWHTAGSGAFTSNVPSNLFLAEQNFSLFGGHFGHLSKNIIYTIPVQRACKNVCNF